jgi:hypothetical protein
VYKERVLIARMFPLGAFGIASRTCRRYMALHGLKLPLNWECDTHAKPLVSHDTVRQLSVSGWPAD